MYVSRLNVYNYFYKVIGFDPFVTSEQCEQFHTSKMELDEIWPLADYITLHTPLIESTRSKFKSFLSIL